MIDLHPAAQRTRRLVASLPDEQLVLPTPCPDLRLGDLVDHVGGLAQDLLAAARKDLERGAPPPPPPGRAQLEPGWRDRISRDLLALAEAWRDPQAWQGATRAGGMELPADVVGLVTLDELVVHGWDIAVTSGQAYEPSPQEVDAVMTFVTSFEAPRDGSLFGPVVPVPDDAPPFERLLGLTGRDPSWRPPG